MLKTKVLVLTGDSLGSSMAGPAIRAFEIAKRLSAFADVHLVSTTSANLNHPEFQISFASKKTLRSEVDWAQILIFQGTTYEPWMKKSNAILVADMYDPIHLELLEQLKERAPTARFTQTMNITAIINRQLMVADHFLCASEKQRDFWLGQLAALGRLNPDNYDQDNSLRRLISVAPFGVQNDEPKQTEHLIKGKIDGISYSDKVIIWGGGIYNWFDPLTLIRAISVLSQKHSNLRLVFMGTKHPNPKVPAMQMLNDAVQISTELKLLNKHVFFNEGWVPYDQRANALLDADVGVSTHLDHLETAFSFRTRILDYLWTGLPIVATRGDTFEPIIEHHGLGKVVDPGDVGGLANAIEEMVYDNRANNSARGNVKAFREIMRWDNTLQSLVEFVQTASPSADAQSDYGQGLRKLSKLNMGQLRARETLYLQSIKRFGLSATVQAVLSNFASRFNRR